MGLYRWILYNGLQVVLLKLSSDNFGHAQISFHRFQDSLLLYKSPSVCQALDHDEEKLCNGYATLERKELGIFYCLLKAMVFHSVEISVQVISILYTILI
jgi:hypothetical protein